MRQQDLDEGRLIGLVVGFSAWGASCTLEIGLGRQGPTVRGRDV